MSPPSPPTRSRAPRGRRRAAALHGNRSKARPLSTETRSQLLADGRAAFNRRDFFGAHERWEAVWLQASGPERRWLQGLIQLAAGLHLLGRGRAAPAARLFERAHAKLADAPERLDGIDLAAARRLAGALGRGEAVDPASVAAL